MGRKSHKAGNWHHTETNRRNGNRKAVGRYYNKKAKNERLKTKRRVRNAAKDLVLFLLFLAIISAVFWLGM